MGQVKDILGKVQFSEGDDKCAFCDRKPTAYWHGINANISVCESCAVDILPRLIADAINIEAHDVHASYTATQQLKRCELSFWQAFAARLSSALHNAKAKLRKSWN